MVQGSKKRELKVATVTNLFGPEQRTAPKKEKKVSNNKEETGTFVVLCVQDSKLP